MPKHSWRRRAKDAIVDTVHGLQVPDPYRWLEDEKSPDVQAWMTRAGRLHPQRAREAARP